MRFVKEDDPKNETDEEQVRMVINPHSNMRYKIGDKIDRILSEDKSRKYGDFLIVWYPKKFLRVLSPDPTYGRYFLFCDFDGNYCELGSEDEKFYTQLVNTQKQLQSLKLEIGKLNFFTREMGKQQNLFENMEKRIIDGINSFIRSLMPRIKDDKKD